MAPHTPPTPLLVSFTGQQQEIISSTAKPQAKNPPIALVYANCREFRETFLNLNSIVRMKITTTFLALLLLATAGFVYQKKEATSTEITEVEQVARWYLEGTGQRNLESLKRAFDNDHARLQYMRDGAYQEVSFLDWYARIESSPNNGPSDREEIIASVDIAGDAAVVKIVLIYPNGNRITDYLSMLKADGEWRIVNKIFTRE